MKDRFSTLMHRLGARGPFPEEYARLTGLYNESSRFYHTVKHVESCLKELDSCRDELRHPDLVELAIWYHDAVYETNAEDNEEKSAQLVYDFCQRAQLPAESAKRARALVLATKHNAIPHDPDARFLADIDLSILGKPASTFNEYDSDIRKEYSWLPDEQYKEGRIATLNMFLERSAIYLTFPFRKKYEAQARTNLQKVLIHRYGLTYLSRPKRKN